MDQSKKYQVFISSTFEDLVQVRRAVIEELLNLGCIPAAMEFFQAINKRSFEIIKQVLNNCDYLVLIVAGRYGSIIKGNSTQTSFVEEEYKHAKKKKIPVIPLLLHDRDLQNLKKSKKKSSRNKIERTVLGQKKLTRFRNRLKDEALIGFFSQESELPKLVANALSEAIIKEPRPGWLRGDHRSNWDVISSASGRGLHPKKYEAIIPLFAKGKGLSRKLKLAFPTTKMLVEPKIRKNKQILRNMNDRQKKEAIASKFYRIDRKTNLIELLPKWEDHDLLYAMCYVSEHGLHTKNRFSNFPFEHKNWWEPPWNNVALYISQICSEEGFIRTIKMLLRDMQPLNQRRRFECLELVYRMIISRSVVNTEILELILGEISSLPQN